MIFFYYCLMYLFQFIAAMHNKTNKTDETDDTEDLSDFVNPSETCVDYNSIKKVCFTVLFHF